MGTEGQGPGEDPEGQGQESGRSPEEGSRSPYLSPDLGEKRRLPGTPKTSPDGGLLVTEATRHGVSLWLGWTLDYPKRGKSQEQPGWRSRSQVPRGPRIAGPSAGLEWGEVPGHKEASRW